MGGSIRAVSDNISRFIGLFSLKLFRLTAVRARLRREFYPAAAGSWQFSVGSYQFRVSSLWLVPGYRRELPDPAESGVISHQLSVGSDFGLKRFRLKAVRAGPPGQLSLTRWEHIHLGKLSRKLGLIFRIFNDNIGHDSA